MTYFGIVDCAVDLILIVLFNGTSLPMNPALAVLPMFIFRY